MIRPVWCVTAFSKPDCKGSVLENFARQVYPGKRLAIVENGEGVGVFSEGDCDLLLRSDRHQSLAKNAALDALSSEWAFATFDCDDYYGKHYLTEAAEALETADVVGKRRHWIDLGDGKLHLIDESSANQPTPWLHGATLAARLNLGARFPIVDINEEKGFWEAAGYGPGGKQLRALSIHHHVYCRSRGDHTYRLSKDGFMVVAGRREEYERDLALVDGVLDRGSKLLRVIEDPLRAYTEASFPSIPAL